MKNCKQTKGQSVLQHGISVWKKYLELKANKTDEWKLPNWFDPSILTKCHDDKIIKQYLIWHDCGKPYCRTEDESGQHFKNHAEVSYETYLQVFDNEVIANLIKHDMVFHTAKISTLEEALKLCNDKDRYTLLVAALCELHSNAEMFGGIESVSFKIKWKKLNKLGKCLK